MSDNRPANPFGRSDRTIIRPNPGGRLPPPPAPAYADAMPAAPQPAAAGFQPVGLPPSGYPTPSPVPAPDPAFVPAPAPVSPSPSVPPSPPRYAQPPSTLPSEDWISTPAQPAPAP